MSYQLSNLLANSNSISDSTLRERIETQPDDPQYLTTVRGFGYRFETPN